MALKEQIKVLSQDKSGRVLHLQNRTGLEVNGRDTGYGPTNGQIADIKEYILQFSRIERSEVFTIRIDTSTGYPVLNSVLNGIPFEVNTTMFEGNPNDRGATVFSDGVLGLVSNSVWPGLTGVVITKGNNYIAGYAGQFNRALEGSRIQVNGKLYDIDESRSSIAGSVLYVVGEFEDDATSFDIVYQGETKILLQAVSDNAHAYVTAKVSTSEPAQQKLFVDDLTRSLHYKIAAKGFAVHCQDWHKANDLVISAGRILNKIISKWR